MADDGPTAESAGPTADGSESGQPEREDDDPEPTPQAAALRRQQLVVGSGVATLAGIAVVVAGTQRYPAMPLWLFFLVGMTTTAMLFMLLYTSIFPGEDE